MKLFGRWSRRHSSPSVVLELPVSPDAVLSDRGRRRLGEIR